MFAFSNISVSMAVCEVAFAEQAVDTIQEYIDTCVLYQVKPQCLLRINHPLVCYTLPAIPVPVLRIETLKIGHCIKMVYT